MSQNSDIDHAGLFNTCQVKITSSVRGEDESSDTLLEDMVLESLFEFESNISKCRLLFSLL